MTSFHLMFDLNCVRQDRRQQIVNLLADDLQERLQRDKVRLERDALYRAECTMLERQLTALSHDVKIPS